MNKVINGITHWMDVKPPPYNLVGHINNPRISAQTIAELFQLKNRLDGIKTTIYEENVMAQERHVSI